MAKTFTKAELAKYNGVDGAPKYVAIDHTVYDLTNVPAWSGDNHHGNVAGQDLTEVIGNSPHKKTVLAALPVVGEYVG